ncbi:hypothetical protein VTJ83DRAFT_773 [Remersonia thermophila]|uniref:Proteasome component ECM29 n=1 Tax=Remersonia thermophila TaxID=72144 RepID=A0ABR4DM92_9PEZI
MATQPNSKNELALIEKVEWRILQASSDEEKLQACLRTYLAPLLLKAGSDNVAVRNKVIAVCQTINKLIKAPGIVLNVAALLDQYKNPNASHALIKHFDLLYIQHSVGKLSPEDQRALIPTALRGISKDPPASVSRLFNVILRLLHALRIPTRGSKEDEGFRSSIGLEDPKDAKFFADWLGKVLLLRTSPSGPADSPGLTSADVSFLTLDKGDTWNLEAGGLSAAETRIKVASLLASGAFTDEERFLPAIHAAASSDYRISGVGDELLKRATVSLEDEALIRTLYDAHGKLPPPYRIRILGILSKSELATTFTDDILAVFRRNAAPAPSETAEGQAPAASKSSGLELTKLHRALFEFVNWVARIGPSKTDYNKIGPPLIELLRDFVASQGWPKAARQSQDESTLRSRAYETIGILAKGATSLSEIDRLALAGWLFRSLSEDPTPDVVVNIDGALSGLTALFRPPHSFAVNTQLQSILLTYMTLREGDGDVVRSARHAVTKWANQCLAFSDVYARWIDILAVAGRQDERSDVVEEGQKGLDPWTYYANDDGQSRASLPDWQEMVRRFFREAITPRNISPESGNMDTDDVGVFANFPRDTLLAFPVAVGFCWRMLLLTALTDFQLEPAWERRLGVLVESDLTTRQSVRGYLSSLTAAKDGSLPTLLCATFEGMIKEDVRVAEPCARVFVELASLSPRATLEPLATRSRELNPLITSNKKELRMLGSTAFGILAAHPVNSEASFVKSAESLVNITTALPTAVGSELNAVEGAFLALSRLVSRRTYYAGRAPESRDLATAFPTLSSLASKPLSTQEALFEAYTQLWTAGIQTLQTDGGDNDIRSPLSQGFIEPLITQAKKGNEKAITALGRLAIALLTADAHDNSGPDDDILGAILQELYSLFEIRQAEVHFAVGEAIAAAVACWDADVVKLTLDVQAEGNASRARARITRLRAVLDKLLADCKTTKPSLLKASGIWLFCIIQHCSHLDEVQSRLRECQAAFMRLLSARDELVQETASRGLSLVYDKGDAALKGDLVRDLVAAFTGSGPQLKVDQDTELFEAGALPTGEGKSITSYKDIVSLANEVGDPSLVYKFMSLATNAATWSTRSAFGRFGLSSILSESEIDPKLYPKLYRYRFDPNQNVQRSMNDIWKALVKDPNAVLETHFDSIMADLLKSILGREWRVREASCAAISDLIAGRPFPKYERYYKDIWTAALKVLDDVKATVRNAALHLCIALSTTLVRQLEESGFTATAQAMMREAVPFLLSDKGIDNSAEEVKLFAIITIIKITKTGGDALKPYIPTLVPHLLGLLSTIEPEAINYHYQRAGDDSREKIDKLRSAMVSRSPLAEAIDSCLRTLDDASMAEFAPQLQNTVKSALGMPTKLGCARVLSTLSTRHTLSFSPYAAGFLALMEKQILDRNDEVSQNYAAAAAYLLRVVPTEASRLRYANHLITLYLSSDDRSEVRRQKAVDALLALSKISPEHLSSLEAVLFPLAFVARHDDDEYVSRAAKQAWDARGGSLGVAVTRFLNEVVELVNKCLESPQWGLRHAGARAVAAAADAVVSAREVSGRVNSGNLKTLWPAYERALALKTFEGKEELLKPLEGWVKAASAASPSATDPAAAKVEAELQDLDQDLWGGGSAPLLKKIVLREAKRNNDAYRPHALACLWKVAAVREDWDVLGEIAEIAGPHVNALAEDDGDKMDVDQPVGRTKGRSGGKGNSGDDMDLKSRTAWAAIEAITRGYNRRAMRERPMTVLREAVLALESAAADKEIKTLGNNAVTSPCLARSELEAVRRVFWYECVKEVLEEAVGGEGTAVTVGGEEQLVVEWFLHSLDLGLSGSDEDNGIISGTEPQRLGRVAAARAVLRLAKARAGFGSGEHAVELRAKVNKVLERALARERLTDVLKAWKECLEEVKG